MIDFRPIGYILGLLVAIFGVFMMIPAVLDFVYDTVGTGAFAISSAITLLAGGSVALATANSRTQSLSIQQTFLITTLAWLVLPAFAALPFFLGGPHLSITDAFFEAMSGLTTTGSTVINGLDDLDYGTLFWRGMLQWFGGVGIVVVAMAFLPALKVGGMQIFRSEGFDTMGKILPRAAEIAKQISVIYAFLTIACILSYLAVGMHFFDAVVHAMTTVSTGGFANYDASFGAFKGAPEYVASVFMLLSSLPFVRYVQILNGSARPLLRDTQIHAFFGLAAILIVIVSLFEVFEDHFSLEESFREAVFNVTSILSGTGYASVDYQLWGPFAVAIFFAMGLVGGCAGSTCCSVKIFRYQLLWSSIRTQIRKIHTPSGVFSVQYQGQRVGDDVLSSVMAFFVAFMLTLATVAVLLGLLGLDAITAISGAATALGNIGPGLGDIIGPSGNFSTLPDSTKWILALTMLIGRLELLSVYVLFTVAFWRH